MRNSHLPISVPRVTISERGSTMPPPPPSNWIAFILCSCMREAKGRNPILLLESHWIQCEERTQFLFPSREKHRTHMWCSAGIQAHSYARPPSLIFQQNNNNKPKSNLTTETTPVWVTNVQRPSPASFPTVLFIIFASLAHSPPPLLPSALLSARNRHSRKCILCKLSSRCYSWFHKWWRNGQESEGVNGKKMAAAHNASLPPSSLLFFFSFFNWMIRKQQMGGRTLTSSRSMVNLVWEVPGVKSLLDPTNIRSDKCFHSHINKMEQVYFHESHLF